MFIFTADYSAVNIRTSSLNCFIQNRFFILHIYILYIRSIRSTSNDTLRIYIIWYCTILFIDYVPHLVQYPVRKITFVFWSYEGILLYIILLFRYVVFLYSRPCDVCLLRQYWILYHTDWCRCSRVSNALLLKTKSPSKYMPILARYKNDVPPILFQNSCLNAAPSIVKNIKYVYMYQVCFRLCFLRRGGIYIWATAVLHMYVSYDM